MTWFIFIPFGFVLGILFSFAFPDVALNVNDAVIPVVDYGVEQVTMIGNELRNDIVEMVF